MAITQPELKESLSETLKHPRKYAKAIAGALLAGITAAGTAAVDGFDTQEYFGIAAAVVSTFIGVYWTDNKP